MKKIVFNVMLITAVAKLFGFAREIILSSFIGANGVSDAYLVSLAIPGTIFQLIGTGLATCFIPIFLKMPKEKKNNYTNAVLSIILIFSSIAIILVWLFGESIVKIFASGFEGETLRYATLFTKINITSLYISSFIYVFNCYLQAREKFLIVALAAVPNSIAVIFSIIIGAKIDYIFLPIGSIMATFVQLCFLIRSVKKEGFVLKLNNNFKTTEMQKTYKLMGPVIIGVSVNELNVLVDKTVASNVVTGGISALAYANSLIMFVQGLFAQTIATTYYTTISRLVATRDKAKIRTTLSEAISGMLFFLIPITFGCIILSEGIVDLLYGRGAFNGEAVKLTTQALIGYSVGIIGYGIREIFSRVFYSMHNTKIPTTNAIVGVILNIALNIILSKWIGVAGLALATSISSTVTSLLLYISLKKQGIYHLDKTLLSSIIKMLGASAIMGVVVRVLDSLLDIHIGTLISIIAGLLTYLLFSYAFDVGYLKKLTKETLNRLRHRNPPTT